MSGKSMDVFSLRDSIVSEYRKFATSFTNASCRSPSARLARLCAVEGSSSAPAFLLHHSPREGDLDPWTYARLFVTALDLGPDEETAIVTTTTEPPGGDVRKYVRVELSARSDEARFFRADL